MTTRKIAPSLTGFITGWTGISGAPMRRELQDLVAVVRLADARLRATWPKGPPKTCRSSVKLWRAIQRAKGGGR